jgi:hypothetical protein
VRVLLDCVRPDRDCGQLRNVGSTVTIDPYSPLAGRKAELLRWLTEEGRFAPDTGHSRLELLCKDVGRPLLMTGAFAVEVAEPVFEIGHFELRGFRQHQAVYGMCQEGEAPCSPNRLAAEIH